MSSSIPTYLDAVKARIKAATPGPWTLFNTCDDGFCVDVDCPATHADMALIAHAPQDLATLIRVVEHYEAALVTIECGLVTTDATAKYAGFKPKDIAREALAAAEKLVSE